MMMAYRGTGGTILEVRNFFGRWDTEKAKPVGGAFSSDGPALATYDGKPHLVWKGLNDSGLHEQVMINQDSRAWTAPTPVLAGPNGGPVGTIDTPALVEFRGRLFLFWKGLEVTTRSICRHAVRTPVTAGHRRRESSLVRTAGRRFPLEALSAPR
jgi:hypothetical protein